jgi:SAM-dependent methyltransferase
MYEDDLSLLVCPTTRAPLKFAAGCERTPGGEIIRGELVGGVRPYPIRDGIPRFVEPSTYNESWDFKWRALDGGRGLNYRIIDKSDSAYQTHDLFDRNGYGGAVYETSRAGVAIDIGCGVGQYSVRLLQEYSPRKLVALDLTSGVDIFRKIAMERYPDLCQRLLIVQASVFDMPFVDDTFDFAMSLGVLMHTGDTRMALRKVADLVKPGGNLNVWLYGSEPIAYTTGEPGRETVYDLKRFRSVQKKYLLIERWLRFFRKASPERSAAFLRFMSSDFVYKASKQRGFRWIDRVLPCVHHDDAAYRLINNFDGYVNSWSDTWGEHEIFPVLRERSFVLIDLAAWRLGIWARKIPNFYTS